MNKYFSANLLASVGAAFCLSACLTACMTRSDVTEVEQRKNVQQQVSTLQKTNADSMSKYNELGDDVREAHGKIEVLENRINIEQKNREKTQLLTDQQIAESNKKIIALQEEVQKLINQVAFLNQELTKSASSAISSSGAEVGTKSGGSFDLGEQNFARKDYRQAILNYEKYRESSPKGKNFAMATYKIGLSFLDLGMRDDAKTFLEEVITKFPKSPLAKQAKDRLKKK
jgi:TolA-binding protein